MFIQGFERCRNHDRNFSIYLYSHIYFKTLRAIKCCNKKLKFIIQIDSDRYAISHLDALNIIIYYFWNILFYIELVWQSNICAQRNIKWCCHKSSLYKYFQNMSK